MSKIELFLLTCPICGKVHPFPLYELYEAIVCDCGTLIFDIDINEGMVEFRTIRKGAPAIQARYDQLHYFDDKPLGKSE